MAGKVQLFILAILTYALLFGGCGPSGKGGKAQAPRTDEVKRTPADQKKAKLLKRIDRKFENPKTHFQLGQLYQADGLWAEAKYHYNIALRFDPVYWSAQAAMVKVLQESGDTAKAKLSAEIYMNQAAASAEKSLQLGLAFQEQGLDEYALACYQRALHLAPNSANINKHIGYHHLRKGDKTRAKQYLTRSFELNPMQPEVASELGRLGVKVEIPRKTPKSTKKLDKIVEQAGKKAKQ